MYSHVLQVWNLQNNTLHKNNNNGHSTILRDITAEKTKFLYNGQHQMDPSKRSIYNQNINTVTVPKRKARIQIKTITTTLNFNHQQDKITSNSDPSSFKSF